MPTAWVPRVAERLSRLFSAIELGRAALPSLRRNVGLMDDVERLTTESEQKLRELKDKSVEDKAALQQEVSTVRAELRKVEAFIKKEAEMEQELQDKNHRLETESKDHASIIRCVLSVQYIARVCCPCSAGRSCAQWDVCCCRAAISSASMCKRKIG